MRFDQPNTPANINYDAYDDTLDINNNGVEGTDVVIIGGGLSGLYAANMLLENGVSNFVVLEARPRVGGRLFTKKNEKVGYVDLGGSYVGPSQFYMQRIIKKLGLKTFKVNSKGQNSYLNKKKRFLHDCDSLPAMGSLVEMEVKYVFGLIEKMCEEVPLEKPWTAPKAEEWDKLTFGQFLDKHCWTEESRQFISLYMGCCTSCESWESSLLWTLWFTKQCDGLDVMFNIENAAQDSKVVGGTQQISQRLRELIGGEERVHLKKPVSQIVYDQSAEASNGWPVTVSTLDGSKYHTKYVIMAIPFALQAKIHFSPALPPMYQQLTQKFPMGSVIKCIVYYKEAFWREDNLTGSMIINLPGELGPISYTLDDTKPDGSYPAIVGFIIGERVKLMLDKTKEERMRLICDSYAKALGNDKALEPIHYEEKNWSESQYTGGCFTAFGMPSFLTNYGNLLRKPLLNNRVHLAGTETATFWSGYMDGALQAGERAALHVLSRLGVKVNKETVLERPNQELLKRKKSLQAMARERRNSNSSVSSKMNLTLSINQLITWSGILMAVVGFIITTSF